ncbi:unnamed protein product, partial [Adineta ricciae]
MLSPASFAQTRILLDQQSRSHFGQPLIPTHNLPFIYQLSSESVLSVEKLSEAIQLVLFKHESLRTSLIFKEEINQFIQTIIDPEDKHRKLFTLVESTFNTLEQLNNVIYDEKYNSQLFDLSQGLVFRCHIVYFKGMSSNGLLRRRDSIVFNFHHAVFDHSSMNIFLQDLNDAYTNSQLAVDNGTSLRYIDYSITEQQMLMTAANMFWMDALHDCKLDQSLSLPYDRYRLANEHRTGRGTSVSFTVAQDLSQALLTFASSNNVNLQHLALTIYYVFLFKLTGREKDLCVGMNVENRYRGELKTLIGLFENTIPVRCHLDPCWSFHRLMKNVHEVLAGSLEYSYFPLQRILAQHANVSKAGFLDVFFEFMPTNKNDQNEIMIGDCHLSLLPISIKISEDEIMSKFDFIVSAQHDRNTNQLSFILNASLDLFNANTVDKMAQHFHSMLEHMFRSSASELVDKPVYELSLTLPDEKLLMQSMNNKQAFFPQGYCIHHQFVHQVTKYPQKLVVELDEQSLTYSEFLYYVQMLSLNLMNEYEVKSGEIICQLVERSLSMVIGMMSIVMTGGVYCPLSPRDPQHRLQLLLQQTQSRLVLIHSLTKTKFDDNTRLCDIDVMLAANSFVKERSLTRLSSVEVMPSSIAYIIFTSGSTGLPKAVQVRHRNFSECIRSLTCINSFNQNDIIIQMARCSFDIHVQEVLGTLMIGTTLVMLHPRGTVDFDYLSKIFDKKQITYMHTVPSLLHSFFSFLQNCHSLFTLRYLRSLCSIGEPFSIKLNNLIMNIDIAKCSVWNLYGPAETTIASTFHLVDVIADQRSVPIGLPLPNYQCVIIDEFAQNVIIEQVGELLIGGAGIFAGYLGRHDLTARAIVAIDEDIFYRTGDLVQMDRHGLLHYKSRKDHQIKLHGQRIELGEIEQCL